MEKYCQITITLPDDHEGPFDPTHELESFIRTYRNDDNFNPEDEPCMEYDSYSFDNKTGQAGPCLSFKSNFSLKNVRK